MENRLEAETTMSTADSDRTRPETVRPEVDMSLLMCHESSPVCEEVVESDVPPPTACSSTSFVPIAASLASLEHCDSELRRSFVDPVLLLDRRVLTAMLSMDDQCLPSAHYFKYTQPDLLPFMRRVVVSWMLEVRMATSP